MTPDMLLSAAVFSSAALMLRIRARRPSSLNFVLLGIALGCGFLAKAIMLPLAPLFIAGAITRHLASRFAPLYLLATLMAFTGLAAPYVYGLSHEKSRFTTGDAALNYAFHLNHLPFVNWKGDLSNFGKPSIRFE